MPRGSRRGRSATAARTCRRAVARHPSNGWACSTMSRTAAKPPDPFCPNPGLEDGPVVIRDAAPGPHQRERRDALPVVRARFLAEHVRIRRVVEQVVDELKGRPDAPSEPLRRGDAVRGGVDQERAEAGGEAEQAPGLEPGDLQALAVGEVEHAVTEMLLDFAAQRRGDRPDDRELHAAARAPQQHVDGRDHEGVAEQDADLVAEHAAHRRGPPPMGRVVQDVVVVQGRQVHHLDRGGDGGAIGRRGARARRSSRPRGGAGGAAGACRRPRSRAA